jgi:hypothetical protein
LCIRSSRRVTKIKCASFEYFDEAIIVWSPLHTTAQKEEA